MNYGALGTSVRIASSTDSQNKTPDITKQEYRELRHHYLVIRAEELLQATERQNEAHDREVFGPGSVSNQRRPHS